DTHPFTTRSRTRSVQAFVNYSFSERWSAYAAYGPSWTHTATAAAAVICPVPVEFCQAGFVPFTVFPTEVTRDARGSIYDLKATSRVAEESSLALAASRGTFPTGAGFVSVTEALSATLAHRLAEHLSATLSVTQTKAQSVGGLVAFSATRARGLA